MLLFVGLLFSCGPFIYCTSVGRPEPVIADVRSILYGFVFQRGPLDSCTMCSFFLGWYSGRPLHYARLAVIRSIWG